MNQIALAATPTVKSDELACGLGLFDSTMFVVGVMIGSGIFIVPAETTCNVGSAGWLPVARGGRRCTHHRWLAVLWRTVGHDASRRRHVSVSAGSLFSDVRFPVRMDPVLGH